MASESSPKDKQSELKTRVISGIVLIAAALAVLAIGSIPFLIAIVIVGGLVFYEFSQLVDGFAKSTGANLAWKAFGLIYVCAAVFALWQLRDAISGEKEGLGITLWVLASVWAVDIGAYFAGRAIGGPKIAPAISPSKTWAGLGGGIVGAALATIVAGSYLEAGLPSLQLVAVGFMLGVPIAIVAQAGDFFESWLKRRAGVKDSGTLIPGHGGVFDRVDGLLPVAILAAVLVAWLSPV